MMESRPERQTSPLSILLIARDPLRFVFVDRGREGRQRAKKKGRPKAAMAAAAAFYALMHHTHGVL